MDRRHLAGGGLALTGLVVLVVQVVHGLVQTDQPVALAFEAGPFVLLAGTVVFVGGWLARTEWVDPDATAIVGWTSGGTLLFLSVAALVLLVASIVLEMLVFW